MNFLPKLHDFIFIKREKVAKNTYSFYFSKLVDFDFFPGQYIRMKLKIDTKTLSHFFTIASSPSEKKHIVITVKMRDSLFKQALLDITPGEKLSLYGPLGGFYMTNTDVASKVFIAGGIGITPFYSMITYIAAKKLSIPVTLFASFATYEDVLYSDELLRISHEMPNIHVIYTLTQADSNWKGEHGRISEKLLKKYINGTDNTIYYIVGSGDMVGDMEELLESMEIPLNRIKIESFTGY